MPIISNFPTGGGTGGGGLALAAVTDITTLVSHEKVYVKWTDPDDMVVAGSTLAAWGGTLLVRKAGSMPVSRRDGTVVLDSQVRNQYQDAYFCDSGLTDGETYYYKFFPYTTTNTYTESEDCEFTATPEAPVLGDVSGMSAVAAGNGKLAIKWTDPAATIVTDGVTLATWAKTTVVVKEGSYATSPDDADAVYTLNSTTRNQYASSALTVTGLKNGTTYYVSFFPTSTDGAVNVNTSNRITGEANRMVISAVPSQSGTLTYSGSAQSPSWSNYDSSKMTLSVTAQTNAGTYNATFTPKDDYMWSDETTAAKTVNWTIGRATISTVPSQSGSLTYTGSAQSPTWSGYDSSKMTIGGTTSSTNAGTFAATFTPNSNYQWSDGTTTAKSVNWTMAKAAGSLSLNKTSVTLNSDATSATVTVTRAGDGAITATSSDTSVATVSVSGTTLTIKSVNDKTGTATITVSVAAGTNHNAPSNKTIAVSAEFLPAVGTALNSCSWEDISKIAAAGLADTYWDVGATKTITINGTVGTLSLSSLSVDVFIIGFDHNSTYEGTNKIHFQIGQISSKLVGLIDSKYASYATDGTKYFNMNHWGNYNYGGWAGCDLRYDILGSTDVAPSGYGSAVTTSRAGYDASATCATNPVANTLMAALPSDLRAVMKGVTKYADAVGNSSNVTANVKGYVDYLFLLAEFEVQGARSYANQYEQNYQKQYAYYSAGNSKVFYRHSATSSTAYWWLRSAYYYITSNFCYVGTDGSAHSSNARYAYALAPGFVV